jgi:hypothetical protein
MYISESLLVAYIFTFNLGFLLLHLQGRFLGVN